MGSKCFLDLYSVPRSRTRDLGMRAFAGLTAFFGVIAILTARLLTKKAVSTINRSAMKIVDQSFRRGSSNVRLWHKADIVRRWESAFDPKQTWVGRKIAAAQNDRRPWRHSTSARSYRDRPPQICARAS